MHLTQAHTDFWLYHHEPEWSRTARIARRKGRFEQERAAKEHAQKRATVLHAAINQHVPGFTFDFKTQDKVTVCIYAQRSRRFGGLDAMRESLRNWTDTSKPSAGRTAFAKRILRRLDAATKS